MTKKIENKLSNTIISKIEELKKSPVYNMSLHNKELFHSNFWAWLMDNYPEFISVFFPIEENILKDKKKNTDYWLLREYKNTDLALKIKKDDGSKKFDVYVIENKLKSLPSEEQLKKYSENIEFKLDKNKTKISTENLFKKGYLISFIRPSFFEQDQSVKCIQGKIWKYISYDEVINKLKSKLNNKKFIKTKYHKSIINDYINIVEKIFDILSSILTESFQIKVEIKNGEINPDTNLGNGIYNPNIGFDRRLIPDGSTKNKNKSIENEDEYYFKDRTFEYLSKKLQMFAFAQYMEKDEKFKNSGWEIKDIGIGNTGKDKALITIEKEIPNTNPKRCIGIQIEGDNYRYYVAENLDVITTKDGKTEKQNKIKKVEEEKKLIEKLYNIYLTWIKMGGRGNRNKIDDNNNSCNKFNQNPYFVYRYKKIKYGEYKSDKYTITLRNFQELKKRVLEDINETNKIINDKK